MNRKTVGLFLIAAIFLSCRPGQFRNSGEQENRTGQVSGEMFLDQRFEYFTRNKVNGGEPITIKLWINEDWSDSYALLVEEYRKYRPNVSFEIKEFSWVSYWLRMGTAMQTGAGPDIFHMHPYHLLDYMEYLAPLPEEHFPEAVMKDLFSDIEALKIGGNYYCFNLGSTTGGIFYNRKLWQEAGLGDKDIPRTWEELRTTAMALTRRDEEGNFLIEGFNFNNNADIFLMALQLERGQPLFTPDGTRTNFNVEENIANVQFLRDLVFQDKLGTFGGEPQEILLGTGRAAMIFGWPWISNFLERNYPEVEFEFFRIPNWDLSVPPAYNYNNFELSFCINAASGEGQKNAAYDLLLFYLCNDKVLLKVSDQGKLVPSKISLLETHYSDLDEVVKIQAEYLDSTEFLGIRPNSVFNYLQTVFAANIMNVALPIKQMMESTDAETEKILLPYIGRRYGSQE
ncbi:MAG: extracellular solute-binding protein [Spirochaetaceae bacterium]|jgi:multiple sugar transport system substrate-binding protein|nr:extracellular solute-binding protein [Spirochaetaceae bacterium]